MFCIQAKKTCWPRHINNSHACKLAFYLKLMNYYYYNFAINKHTHTLFIYDNDEFSDNDRVCTWLWIVIMLMTFIGLVFSQFFSLYRSLSLYRLEKCCSSSLFYHSLKIFFLVSCLHWDSDWCWLKNSSSCVKSFIKQLSD